MRLGQTVEIMAAGFEIRTGRHHTTRAENGRASRRGCFIGSAQLGGAFSLKGASRGVLASMVVAQVKPVVLHASAWTGRDSGLVCWRDSASSIKPVPNVSAGKGDSPSRPTNRFLVKDNG